MVNLKTYLLEATAGEERLPEVLAQLRKYVQLGDREFTAKFFAALRDILPDKTVSARQKYFALQLVNLALQGRSALVAEFVEEKLLERLFLLAMFEAKAGAAETRGQRLLKQFDEQADEEASADFYALLLECFAFWGKEPLSPAFAAKHTTLARNVALPATQRHLFKYAEGSAPEREGAEPSTQEERLLQLEGLQQQLERLSRKGGKEDEGAARNALKELKELLQHFEDSPLRQKLPAKRARELLDRVQGKEADLLPALQAFFGAEKPNPFHASVDDVSPREPPSPEDIRTLAAYVERERANFLRKISSLEADNKRLFDEKRRAELKLLALEAEIEARQGTVAALEEEAHQLRNLGGSYLREGLEYFRRNAGSQRLPAPSAPFAEVSRYSTISQRRMAEERPRTFPAEEPQPKSYFNEDQSAQSTRSRSFYDNALLGREALAAPLDKARSLNDISNIKGQFQYSADFVANFNADIATILNRKSAVGEAASDAGFARRRQEDGFGLGQTLDLSRGKSRAQSSRLQDYVKRYAEGEGSPMFDADFRKHNESMGYRSRLERAEEGGGYASRLQRTEESGGYVSRSERTEEGAGYQSRVEGSRGGGAGILKYKHY